MSEEQQPLVVVIGGPNGAGKSTIVPIVLSECHEVSAYVNADDIARGLAPESPESVALQAGRMMLTQLRDLSEARRCFAFESTLSTRSFAPFIRSLRDDGYKFRLYFMWVNTPDLSVQRVARRVTSGGHHVPETDVRRRYFRAIHNLIHLYIPIADHWIVYDNSQCGSPKLVAEGRFGDIIACEDDAAWQLIQKQSQQTN